MLNFIKKELFLTYDIEIYLKAKEKLAQNGIKYYIKTLTLTTKNCIMTKVILWRMR